MHTAGTGRQAAVALDLRIQFPPRKERETRNAAPLLALCGWAPGQESSHGPPGTWADPRDFPETGCWLRGCPACVSLSPAQRGLRSPLPAPLARGSAASGESAQGTEGACLGPFPHREGRKVPTHTQCGPTRQHTTHDQNVVQGSRPAAGGGAGGVPKERDDDLSSLKPASLSSTKCPQATTEWSHGPFSKDWSRVCREGALKLGKGLGGRALPTPFPSAFLAALSAHSRGTPSGRRASAAPAPPLPRWLSPGREVVTWPPRRP